MIGIFHKTTRLAVVLLTGATLAHAGSLTQPCKNAPAKDKTPLSKSDRLEAFCEAGLGRSDAGLKGSDSTTWNQSGAMFSAKYSALLTTPPPVEKPNVELDGKSPSVAVGVPASASATATAGN